MSRVAKPLLFWLAVPATLGAIFFLYWLYMYAIVEATTRTYQFEGPGLRYWLFVKGSRLERLGLVSPTGPLPQYTIRPQEGTFPGWNVVLYGSQAAPEDIIAHYARRCREMGFKITEQGPRQESPQALQLVCEIEPYIDVEVVARRPDATRPSDVAVKVWGNE